MDQELAAMYGTPGRATQEDTTKVAEAELFAKLAAENGINLNELNDSQIQQLWDQTFAKQAEETCPKCKKAKDECKCPSEEKTAAAARVEFEKTQEWREKVGECDKLGRVMAHAYVQELGLIDQALKKQAEFPPEFMHGKKNDHDADDKGKKEEKKESKKDEKEEKKEASAIDQLAAKQAVVMAKEAGLDPEIAAKRVDAVLTLGGPGPSEKTASATTLEETIQVRALEFLEKAGYPVTWNK
jgi:hypothetical protein